jgi:hypothetical protein
MSQTIRLCGAFAGHKGTVPLMRRDVDLPGLLRTPSYHRTSEGAATSTSDQHVPGHPRRDDDLIAGRTK